MQQIAATRDRLKSELDNVHRLQQETTKSEVRKAKMPREALVTRLRPESKMEVNETTTATGRINLDRVPQEQMSEDLET